MWCVWCQCTNVRLFPNPHPHQHIHPFQWCFLKRALRANLLRVESFYFFLLAFWFERSKSRKSSFTWQIFVFSLHFRENTPPSMYLLHIWHIIGIKGSKQKLLRYVISKRNLVIPSCNAKCHKLFSNLPHYLLLLPITKTSNLPSQSPYQHWACIWFRTYTPWKCKWYNEIYLHVI
jgi:hypothetical protein